MNLFDSLLGKNGQPAAPKNTVIPEHYRKKMLAEQAQDEKAQRTQREIRERKKKVVMDTRLPPEFEISDVFAMGGISMLKGTVLKGRIKPKAKIMYAGKKFSVKEIRQGSMKTTLLLPGDEGTLFLGNLKKIPFRAGDIVLFAEPK